MWVRVWAREGESVGGCSYPPAAQQCTGARAPRPWRLGLRLLQEEGGRLGQVGYAGTIAQLGQVHSAAWSILFLLLYF